METPIAVHVLLFNFFSALAGLGVASALRVLPYRRPQTLGKLALPDDAKDLSSPEVEEEHLIYKKVA